MSYYTSLLNSDVYDVEDTKTTELPIFSTQDCSKQKRGRATNFSIDEDMLLISAWQNVSMDPIQGSNQTHQTYWNRIASYYDENKSFSSVRTPNSLCHRWSAINTSVSKFIGYYNQIQGRNQSGLCEQDKERQAMEMYTTLQKKAFQLVHCWTVLRNCPKFGATIQKKPKKSPNDSPKSSASAQSSFISKSSPDSEAREERDNRMYEMSILGIDTSTMEAPLAQYYKSLKDDILKKRM